MTLNVELLDRTLAHIEQDPEHWYQAKWRCGTGMCFAGWAATLAGGKWAYPENALWGDGREPTALLIATDDDPKGDIDAADGCVHVEDRARRVLGLDYEAAETLFDAANSLDDIRDAVADLKAGGS